VGSTETFGDVSPIDEQPIREIARGDKGEADRGVAARSAFDTWGRTSAADRAKVVHRVAEIVEDLEAAPCSGRQSNRRGCLPPDLTGRHAPRTPPTLDLLVRTLLDMSR